MSPGQSAAGQILMLEADAERCAPFLRLSHLADAAQTCTNLSDLIASGNADSPFLILLSAFGRPSWVLDRWRDLFALRIPIVIVHAPDQSFALEALRRGADECFLEGTQPELVTLRLQRTLERERDRLQSRARLRDIALTSQMQSDFFRVFSHDLKGPLTNLRMALYLLRDLVGGSAEASEILTNADMSLSEMQDMVRMFLDAAAAQPGKIDVRIECLSAADIVRRLLRQHGLTASRKGIALDVHCDDVLLLADPQLLAHVVSNLVGNAVKFTPTGGRVDVHVEGGNGSARISVIDSGPGIPLEERSELFQPFARISNQPTGMETSTGLGLWIVKHLTEMQHGKVGAHFPTHGGSVFYIDLPSCSAST